MGLPYLHSRHDLYQPLGLKEVASTLVREFTRTKVLCRHMCPLDLVDSILSINFGGARVGGFGAGD